MIFENRISNTDLISCTKLSGSYKDCEFVDRHNSQYTINIINIYVCRRYI